MKLIYKIILASFTCLIICIYWFSTISEGEYYRRHSPDGQYSIYVSRNKYFNSLISYEKFGDVAGKIHLYDELENKVVACSSIDLISNINELCWNEEELYAESSIRIKLPRKINIKIINQYKKTFPVKYSWKLFLNGKHYTVNKKINRLTVKNEKGKIILENIKFIDYANNGFQVLNNYTEIEYYNAEMKKIKNAPDTKIKYDDVCGNVTTYGLKIEENREFYFLKKAIGHTNYDFQDYKNIDSITREKVKSIYFLNRKRNLTYNENSQVEEDVIIDFGTHFGILSNKMGVQYFDSIDLSKIPIKVMRNNRYGYYNICPIRYTELSPFEFNLAKFRDENNRKGYVDVNGNEYYK
ncbi:MAG: hypothetical protein JKY08_04815 [Flavobacteriaceae bacterium]|nr:hypothetical protein [Flavobacteriaceae bacterium]